MYTFNLYTYLWLHDCIKFMQLLYGLGAEQGALLVLKQSMCRSSQPMCWVFYVVYMLSCLLPTCRVVYAVYVLQLFTSYVLGISRSLHVQLFTANVLVISRSPRAADVYSLSAGYFMQSTCCRCLQPMCCSLRTAVYSLSAGCFMQSTHCRCLQPTGWLFDAVYVLQMFTAYVLFILCSLRTAVYSLCAEYMMQSTYCS